MTQFTLTLTPRPDLENVNEFGRAQAVGNVEALVSTDAGSLRVLAFKADRSEGVVFRFDLTLTLGDDLQTRDHGAKRWSAQQALRDRLGLRFDQAEFVLDTLTSLSDLSQNQEASR